MSQSQQQQQQQQLSSSVAAATTAVTTSSRPIDAFESMSSSAGITGGMEMQQFPPSGTPLVVTNTAPNAAQPNSLATAAATATSATATSVEPPALPTSRKHSGQSGQSVSGPSMPMSNNNEQRICAHCMEPIRGSFILALDRSYHLEHFMCSMCNKLFGAEDNYYEHEDDVYCEEHYNLLVAVRCSGCNQGILGNFVEINENETDSRKGAWHPECYMINRFWGIKIAPTAYTPGSIRRSFVGDGPSLSSVGSMSMSMDSAAAGGLEVLDVLSGADRQLQARRHLISQEQIVQIWEVYSSYEETSAACISEMLLQVSLGNIREGLNMAERFIHHVDVLFNAIDELEVILGQQEDSTGLQHTRQPKILSKKVVSFFSTLAGIPDGSIHQKYNNSNSNANQSEGVAMDASAAITQELLLLVTGLAHYLKTLLRIALLSALRAEREYSISGIINGLLRRLKGASDRRAIEEFRRSYIDLTIYADRCKHCSLTIEEGCLRAVDEHNNNSNNNNNNPATGPLQWHYRCFACVKCGSDLTQQSLSGAILEPSENVVMCSNCCTDIGKKEGSKFREVSQLEQYSFILRVSLKRLCELLEMDPNTAAKSVVRDATDKIRDPTIDDPKQGGSIGPLNPEIKHLDRALSKISPAEPRLPEIVQRKVTTSNQQSPSPPILTPHQQQQQQQQQHTTSAHVRAPIPSFSNPAASQQQQQPPSEHPRKGSIVTDLSQLSIRPAAGRQGHQSLVSPINGSPTEFPGKTDQQTAATTTIRFQPTATFINQVATNDQSLPPSLPSHAIPHEPSQKKFIFDLLPHELHIARFISALKLHELLPADLITLEELLSIAGYRKQSIWQKLNIIKPKNTNKKASSKTQGTFGVSLDQLMERGSVESQVPAKLISVSTNTLSQIEIAKLNIPNRPLRIPMFLEKLLLALIDKDMTILGIFRKNGNVRRLNDLTMIIDKDPNNIQLDKETPVLLAALLKKFLRELPDPLFTQRLHKILISCEQLMDDDNRHQAYQLAMHLLPSPNRDVLEVLLPFLRWVASHCSLQSGGGSKMDIPNMGIVMAPNLMYTDTKESLQSNAVASIDVVVNMLFAGEQPFLTHHSVLDVFRSDPSLVDAMALQMLGGGGGPLSGPTTALAAAAASGGALTGFTGTPVSPGTGPILAQLGVPRGVSSNDVSSVATGGSSAITAGGHGPSMAGSSHVAGGAGGMVSGANAELSVKDIIRRCELVLSHGRRTPDLKSHPQPMTQYPFPPQPSVAPSGAPHGHQLSQSGNPMTLPAGYSASSPFPGQPGSATAATAGVSTAISTAVTSPGIGNGPNPSQIRGVSSHQPPSLGVSISLPARTNPGAQPSHQHVQSPLAHATAQAANVSQSK